MAGDHRQDIRAQSPEGGVSTFSAPPLLLPSSVSVGLNWCQLRGNGHRLWLPKGPAATSSEAPTPTLRVAQNGLCSAAGEEPPAVLPLGTTGNTLWGPTLRTNSRLAGVASGQRVLVPCGTKSRKMQGTGTRSLRQAPSPSRRGLVGVWGAETPISKGDQACWPPALAGWVGDIGG